MPENSTYKDNSVRPKGQQDALLLKCKPIPIVRVALIGLGRRASRAIKRFMFIDGLEIKALCDTTDYNLHLFQNIIAEYDKPKPAEYIGTDAWIQVCERNDIDLVYICTDWLSHAKIAVYAMEYGKHAAVEVPIATTVDECWQLVNTCERTRRHCMMLENCCYDRFELASLKMVQNGVLGEIIHGEGAYIHDLRELNFMPSEEGGYNNDWQKRYYAQHTGNLYPTHGLGPICQAMNIHRGDKLEYLVSMSSKQIGITEFVKSKFGKDSHEANIKYNLGDMNITLIKTAKEKTIMLQHDMTSPRPYSRIHLLSGTKGYLQKYPTEIIALAPNSENALSKEAMDSLLEQYEHPFRIKYGEIADKVANIRARDFVMDSRLIYCLQNGLPLDQDVYDAAEWSSIVELSEKSVLNGSMPIEIPDFTRGSWNKLKGIKFAE